MSGRRHIGDPEYLKKRIPNNPKYEHIRTRLDTGSSMTKYIEKLEEIKRNYRYKKDELFKRLKVTTFAQLALQVASVADELHMTNEELLRMEDSNSVVSDADTELPTMRSNGKGSPEEAPSSPIQFIDNNMGAGESINTSRSTLQSVISGVGEMDVGKACKGKMDNETTLSPRALDTPYSDCPYLLLDVRDRDAYEQCRIIGAYNYPIAMLSRTMNPYTSEIQEFKNAHGKIIILYDEDERIASQAATTMCERGFENVFMLSGGLKVIAQKFPEGLTTGSFPASCLLSPAQATSARKRPTPRPPTSPAENKWRFRAGDLQKIEQHLEQMLVPADTASRLSRLSSGRLDSKASGSWNNNQTPSATGSASARSLVSNATQSKPWK